MNLDMILPAKYKILTHFTEIVLPGDPVAEEEENEEVENTNKNEEVQSTEINIDQDVESKATTQGAEGSVSKTVKSGPSGDQETNVLSKSPEKVIAQKGNFMIIHVYL